jgi:hypothetical protein
MIEQTESEQLFEAYCTKHGIPFEKLLETTEKTADYVITLGGQEIVVEVKELQPNSEEEEEIEHMRNGGVVVGDPIMGKRIRSKIDRAEPQLTKDANGRPAILLLFDTVWYKFHTCSDAVGIAMYGLHGNGDKGSIGADGTLWAIPPKFTATTHTVFSAIAVLHDPTVKSSARTAELEIYHNRYAAVRLSPALFKPYGALQYMFTGDDGYRPDACVRVGY